MTRCPECFGKGRVVLFTSDTRCGACGGTGVVREVAEQGPDAERTHGHVDAIGEGRETVPRCGGSVTISGGNSTTASGGDFVITGGDASGGTFTLSTAGTATNAVAWDATDAPSSLTISSAGAPSVEFQTGTEHPGKDRICGSPGSLYFRNDDGVGRLYLKTGPDSESWAEVRVAGAEGRLPDDESGTLVEGEVDPVPWTVAKLRELGEFRGDGYPKWLCAHPIPVIAPLSESSVADAVALMEQAGHQVSSFVTSCRDFADVRKMKDSDKIRWDGGRVWIFGVEVLRSSLLEPGSFCAVSRDGHMAACFITR